MAVSALARALTATVAGLALTLTACSGGDGGTASASSGADAEAFCAKARAVVSTLGGNVFTDPRGVQRVASQIDALTPPAAIASKWPAFLDYVHQIATISPRDPQAASKALDVLGRSSKDVTDVGRYLVDTCKIDAAASELSDFSDLSPNS